MIKINQIKEETADYIKRHFSYNPETGGITRDDRRNSTGFIKRGYLCIKVKGIPIMAHRIAWFLHYGKFPDGEVDHINRCKTDNRIFNLREADRHIQCVNRGIKPNRTTGVRGVCFQPFRKEKPVKKPYYMKFLGKTRWFYSIDEAIKFRKENNLRI